LIEKLHSGERVLGTLIVSPSPRWPDAVRQCGLDFVFIDTEHIALDRQQVSWMCQAYAALGLPPIVRIPSPDPFAATMALDGGAVKLRPIKGRKLQGLLKGDAPEPELAAYVAPAAKNKLLVVNIESVPAIEALDEILAVPGLDAVLIGPHDLSCNLGMPEQYARKEFLTACETIFRKARKAGVGAGIHYWGSAEEQARFLEMGANLLIHSADITLFQKHLRQELDAVKQLAGVRSKTGAASSISI